MDKRFFQWIGFGFVVVALLAICLGLMKGIANTFTPDKKGDLATWVGAFFTGAAFAGTIWIATAGRRRLRVQATIVVPGLTGYVIDMLVNAEAIAVGLEHWISAPADQKNDSGWAGLLKICQNYSNRIPKIPDQYLLDFADLSKSGAGQLHRAQSNIRVIQTYMNAMDSSAADKRDEEAQHLADICKRCGARLRRCKTQLDDIWREHGFEEI